MPGLAELRLETDGVHERLVFPVPNRLATHVPAIHDAFHVVRQNVFRDAHELKSVDHADEQVLLLGIGEELNEHAAAVMAADCETGDPVFVPARVQNRHEAPVHLESLSRFRLEPLSAAALRLHQMPLRRNQFLVGGDVDLNGGGPARIADRLEPLQTHCGIRDAALEQRVEGPGEAIKSPSRGNLAGISVREELKAVQLQPPKALPRHAGTALQLGQVYLFKVVCISGLRLHFFKRLGNSLDLLLVIQVLHSTSFPWAVYGSSILL